jgi:hypothetical protein
LEFYTILMSYADDLQAVSVDEALIDVTSTVAQMKVVPIGGGDASDGTSTDIARELAESMRAQIKAATGCEGMKYFSHTIANSDIVISEHWDCAKHHACTSRHPPCKASWLVSPAPSRIFRATPNP